MNVPNSTPLPPSSMGPPMAPITTPMTPGANPIPIFPGMRDPSQGPPPELGKRQILPLPLEQLASRGPESQNPARIITLLFQIAVLKPQAVNAPEAAKTAQNQRDETGNKEGKVGAGKGADLVKSEVFTPEGAKQGTPNEKFQNEQETGKSPTPEETKAGVKPEPKQAGELKSPVNEQPSEIEQTSVEKVIPESELKEAVLPGEKEKLVSQSDKPAVSPESARSDKEIPKETREIPKPATENEVQNRKMPEENTGERIVKNSEQAKIEKPVQSLIEQPRLQEAVKQTVVERPKDSPERTVEKIKDKELVEAVQRDDKYQQLEHPDGHRVLEHGQADNRSDAAAQHAAGGDLAHGVDTDKVIPPWIAVLFQEQNQSEKLKNRGKGGGHKQSNELVEHKLMDLLFMLLAGAICGNKSISEYVKFIQSREKWFKVVLGGNCQLPPKEMVWKILSTLNPVHFQQFLYPWLEELCGHPSRLKNQDGKPVLPGISIWQSPLGLMMGQSKGSDPQLDRIAIPTLLKLFSLRGGLIMAKTGNSKLDLAEAIEKEKTDFMVEIFEESARDEIDSLISAATNRESPLYKLHESYIEGQDRLVVQSLKMSSSDRLHNYATKASIKQIFNTSFEMITSKGASFSNAHYATNLPLAGDEIFDLIRIQKPIENKVRWLLNCQFPPLPMDFSLQQCKQNIQLFHQFASNLLHKTGGDLNVEEKMLLAYSSYEQLLKFIR